MLRFLHPKWLALHLVVWVSAVAMVFLGRWQLHVSEVKHGDLRNLAYAAQWWIFSAFAIFLWVRVLRDARARDAATGATATGRTAAGGTAAGATATAGAATGTPYRGYVMPRSDEIVVDDPEMVAYNTYLRTLAAEDRGLAAEDRGLATDVRDAARPGPTPAPAAPVRVTGHVTGHVTVPADQDRR